MKHCSFATQISHVSRHKGVSTKPNLRRAKHKAGSLQRFPYAMSYIGTYHILLQRKFTAPKPSLTLDLIYHQRNQSLRTNSYFIFFFMFICQNVGNLKGFLLASLHGLYLITLSSYSSTGRGTSSSNKKINKIK